MILSTYLRRQRRRVAFAFVLCVFLCGLVLTLDAAQPARVEEYDIAAPPLQPVATIALTEPQAARRTLVREVDRPDWHLLDGDQLLPAHHGDNPDVLGARRRARIGGATDNAAPLPPAGTQAAVAGETPTSFVVLAEPRRPAVEVQRRALRHSSAHAAPDEVEQLRQLHASTSGAEGERLAFMKELQMADPVPIAAAATQREGQEETAKIALRSLRLVVRLTADEDGDDDEDETTTTVSPRRGSRHGKGASGRTHVAQLPTHSNDEPRVTSPPVAKSGAAAATTVRVVHAADTLKATTRVYSDAELRRRCVISDGRATEPAVLRAMMEGRLRKDCLIVAADVGNDIPSNQNNAKGAVTIASIFISTLFLVFVLIF